MKKHAQNRFDFYKRIAFLTGLLIVVIAVAFALSAQPALANPAVYQPYPAVTDTPTVTLTVAAVTPTVTRTATLIYTLPPPQPTGTRTLLVPVTGADLSQPPGQPVMGIWAAIWLVGLILITIGLRLKLNKR
jgi:hypothetical protein